MTVTKHLALLTVLVTATFIGSSFLTSFTGYRADQLPIPQVDPPIQPVGWAFAIWGVIYGWLVISALYGLIARAADAGWNRARLPLILSLAIGTPWLMVANASPIWATVMIFALLVTAVWALIVSPLADRWLLAAPIGLYAGWLTAASFVSLGATAAGYGIGFGAIGWAWAGIGAALLIALAVQARVPDMPTYAAAVAWALIGILAKNLGSLPMLAAAAGSGAVILGLFAVWSRVRAGRPRSLHP
jgi:hypothetical protein